MKATQKTSPPATNVVTKGPKLKGARKRGGKKAAGNPPVSGSKKPGTHNPKRKPGGEGRAVGRKKGWGRNEQKGLGGEAPKKKGGSVLGAIKKVGREGKGKLQTKDKNGATSRARG